MDPVARFAELVAGQHPPLDRGALAIAAGADPSLDQARWLDALDRLATGVGEREALLHRLFVQARFAGDPRHYHDPRNSLLPHVLTRRRGIPVTLAVVTIEVGRRAGIALQGIGMPGHFLVRHDDQLIDAFDGGRLLDTAAAEQRFRAVAGPHAPFGPHLLAPTPTPAILARMLENLRGIYRARRRPQSLEWVLRMRLALPGTSSAELLELAGALGEQGRWHEGARLLEQAAPEHEPDVRERLLRAARTQRAHLN